jgi:hypothetical protein
VRERASRVVVGCSAEKLCGRIIYVSALYSIDTDVVLMVVVIVVSGGKFIYKHFNYDHAACANVFFERR